MAFEEAMLFPTSNTYDPEALREWLSGCPWAFRDPVEGQLWHVSAFPRDAVRAHAQRLAAPTRFPVGLLVDVRDDAVYLASRASAAVLVRARTLVEHLLACGEWTMRVDWSPQLEPLTLERLFPEALPDLDQLTGDPLGRPVMSGQVVLWAHGDDASPSGQRVLEVHSGGAAAFSVHINGECTHHVRGALSAEALLEWLEATAFIDEDDDEIDGVVAAEDIVHISVENTDGEWSLYIDANNPPPSVQRLNALLKRWVPVLQAWAGEGLPPLTQR